jgi:hypothetical protein
LHRSPRASVLQTRIDLDELGEELKKAVAALAPQILALDPD